MGNRYSFAYIGIILYAIFLTIPSSLLAEAGRVTVAWDPIEDPELAGYTVVWGQSPRAYSGAQNVGMSPEATVTLEAGKTYYMAVRGVDKQGVPANFLKKLPRLLVDPTPCHQ